MFDPILVFNKEVLWLCVGAAKIRIIYHAFYVLLCLFQNCYEKTVDVDSPTARRFWSPKMNSRLNASQW